MTSQKLYDTLTFVDALDKKLNLQATLESIASALTNLVNQPATPQYQSALASSLESFEKSATQLEDYMSPSQYDAIEAMGGGEFFDSAISSKVRMSVEKNAMTPSVAKEFVQELSNRRAKFLTTVRSAKDSLKQLNINPSSLEPGTADLAFIIPRNIFDNQLASFAKELIFINRLLEHFSEGITGEADQVELEQLSSSVPTVALVANASVIAVLAFVVNGFLKAWERAEKIRKIRAEITAMGMKGAAVEELTDQIETTVDEVVEQSTTLVMSKYQGTDGRKHELENAIRQDTHRLFGQIERGLTVEFRAKPDKDGNEEEQKILSDISDLSHVMRFPVVAQQPMLLKGGEIIEGDIHVVSHVKKTTTRKSTSKKGASSDGGAVVS